jgi:hypothetical protein
MGTYQTTYPDAPAIGLPGQIANEECCNTVSREVESAAGIEFGQPAFRGSADHGVVAGAAQALTATPGATVSGSGGTPGNGAIGAVTADDGAMEGAWQVVILNPATNAGAFEVVRPDGSIDGNGAVGVAYNGGINFTLADGSTDFVEDDRIPVVVARTTPTKFVGVAVANRAVPAQSSTPDRYPQRFTGAFLTMGQIYVTAGASVSDGDPVHWNPATKRYTADAAHVRIPDATFDISGVDGAIVEISLKLR